MPPAWSLSSGICLLFLNNGEADDQASPVLQVIEIKIQKGRDGVNRFRLLLSDGESMIYGLCTEEAGEDVYDNRIEKGCVIQLTGFFVTTAVNKKAVLVITAAQLRSPALSIVGNPHNPFVDEHSSSAYPANANRNTQKRDSYITKISKLEFGGKYTIKAKVVSRIALRTWSNAKGEGVYFWVELADASGTVRGTFFREAASKWSPVVEEGKTYVFTACQTKATDKVYAADVMSDIEIVFSNATAIREVEGDEDVAAAASRAVPIVSLRTLLKGSKIDVSGVLSKVGPLGEIRTRTNDELAKRSLEVTDRTGTVELILWGVDAVSFTHQAGEPIVAKELKLGEFNNAPNLSFTRSSSLNIDKSPEAAALLQWWAAAPR